jgi:hypothetical protein
MKRFLNHGRCLSLLAAVLFSGSELAAKTMPADDTPMPKKDIRDVIRGQDFEDAGLHKLTDQELIVLSAQLWGWNSPEKIREDQVEAFGNETIALPEGEKDVVEEIESIIPGEFRGWTGKTVFRLANGQVWEQKSGGKFVTKKQNPVVVIKKGAFGAYYLRVKGFGSKCRVERIR